MIQKSYRKLLPLLLGSLCLLLSSCTFLYEPKYTTTRVEPADETQDLHAQAETAESAGEYKRAAKLYGKLAKLYTEKPNMAIMRSKQAHCQLLAGKIHAAKESYENLLKTFPLYISYEQITDQLRKLAECFENGRGTFWSLRDEHTAAAVYELIIQETPSIHVSLADRQKLAELLMTIEKPEEAANVYQAILKMDPEQNDIRLNFALLIEKFSRQGDGDGRKLRAAIREANTFLAKAPADHPRRGEAEQLLLNAKETQAQRLLTQAKFYLIRRHFRPEAARRYLLDIEKDFPGTQAEAEAKALLQAGLEQN